MALASKSDKSGKGNLMCEQEIINNFLAKLRNAEKRKTGPRTPV